MRPSLFAVLFILSSGLYAQANPRLHIASLKGLSLREQPSTGSAKLEVLPYAQTLNNYEITETVNTIDGYKAPWIKAVFNDGKTGYLFSGYILPVEPPLWNGYEGLEDYLEDLWGEPKVDSIVNRSEYDDYAVKYYYTFSNGVKYGREWYYEWDVNYISGVPLTIEQAYLWFYLIEEKVWNGNHLMKNASYPLKNSTSDTLEVAINPGKTVNISAEHGGYSYTRISYENNLVLIEWGSGV